MISKYCTVMTAANNLWARKQTLKRSSSIFQRDLISRRVCHFDPPLCRLHQVGCSQPYAFSQHGEFISSAVIAYWTYIISYSLHHSGNLALPVIVLVFFTISTTITSFPSLPLAAQLVYQFPNPTWVENLAVRSNGEILVTQITSPDVHLIDPSFQPPAATLVHRFPNVLGFLGITEVEHDVFYIAGGNLTLSSVLVNTPGTYSVWEIDMRNFSSNSVGSASVRKVTDIPGAALPNGVATLSKADKTILLADCVLGGLWRLNIESGAYSFILSDPTMKPNPNVSELSVGIDGLKIHDSYVYYTSSSNGLVCRIPVSKNGRTRGKVEVLAALGAGRGLDDLALDREGRWWVAQSLENLVSVVLTNGTVVVDVMGATDQLTLACVTACAFGRQENTKDLLYCSTSGGIAKPVNGTVTEGGKVVVIDTRGLEL